MTENMQVDALPSRQAGFVRCCLKKGAAQNPLLEKESGKRGRVKRGRIRALIDRLRIYRGEVCRFADNPIVPFTNNQAERDLRMVRMKSKVIGSFRSEQGAIDC